tara:strand:- start:687 stop:1175 length:489 start_codon:yes stop_codon:yes gene_type:complete
MKSLKNLSVLLFASLLINGCATILTGDVDTINFTSDPKGARIVMDGLDIGKTPATLVIKRSGFKDKTITLKLDGYEDRSFLLQKEFNAIAILNFAGIVGWFVDFATGSIMKYSQKSYNLDLSPKGFNIDNLESDKFGRLIIPNEESSFFVFDESVGYKIYFQ